LFAIHNAAREAWAKALSLALFPESRLHFILYSNNNDVSNTFAREREAKALRQLARTLAVARRSRTGTFSLFMHCKLFFQRPKFLRDDKKLRARNVLILQLVLVVYLFLNFPLFVSKK
jgi:hypothetical protein